MKCSIEDLRTKEMINLNTGDRLGYIHDAEFCLTSGQMKTLIVAGSGRMFGLFGRNEDTTIPWDAIRKIGEDVVLIEQ